MQKQNKNFLVVLTAVCVVLVCVVARSAFTSNPVSGSGDSFLIADKNGDGTLDRTEFVNFVKAARLGKPTSVPSAQNGEVKICPKTGKPCEMGESDGCCEEGSAGGKTGGCCGEGGMGGKGGGCCGEGGMGGKTGGCCGEGGMGGKTGGRREEKAESDGPSAD